MTQPPHASVELQWHPFAAEPLVVISPPGSEGLSDTELLTRLPFLQFKRQSWISRIIESRLRERHIKIHSNMEVDSLESISLMVAEGLGVSIVPLRSHCQQSNNKLVVSPFGNKPIKRMVGIIERAANPNLELIQVLHKILVSLTHKATSIHDN